MKLEYTHNPKPIRHEFEVITKGNWTLVRIIHSTFKFERMNYCIVPTSKWTERNQKKVNALKKIKGLKTKDMFWIMNPELPEILKKEQVTDLFYSDALYNSVDDALDIFKGILIPESMLIKFEFESHTILDTEGRPVHWQPVWYDYIFGRVTDAYYNEFEKVKSLFQAHPRIVECISQEIGWYNRDCGNYGLYFGYVPTPKELKDAWEFASSDEYPSIRYREYFFGWQPKIDPVKISKYKKPTDEFGDPIGYEKEEDDFGFR